VNARHDPVAQLVAPALEPGMAVPIEAFLDWVEREEGKYEYDRGTIGMMVKVTRNHSALGSRFIFMLMQQLASDRYDVLAEAFAVHVGNSVRFPDVLVQAAGQDGGSLESERPLLIVEVLSPSSAYLDHVVKRDEYLRLPTLQAYVVANPGAAKLTLWERSDDGAFPSEPQEITGLDTILTLRGLAVSLPLADLYRGISF
jgi:Uma2 family endonuclease